MASRIVHIRTKYINQRALLSFGQYENGATAISLFDPQDGEPLAVATVNLPHEVPAPGRVFIKNYSENEGMVSALLQAGVISLPHRLLDAGYVTEGVAEVTLLS